mmetsp:Transcript_14734/g.47327  ORF Transcript_14734/g.47327 Transcript_14734/m.47327 type:complete len:350 (+) Transcript_14734:557-1606(+)
MGLWQVARVGARLQAARRAAPAVVLAAPLHVAGHRRAEPERRRGGRRHLGAARLLPAPQGAAAPRAQPDLHTRPPAHLRRPQRRLRVLPELRLWRARAVGDRRGPAARGLLLRRGAGRVRRGEGALLGKIGWGGRDGRPAPVGRVDDGTRSEALLGRGGRLLLRRAAAPAALPGHVQAGGRLVRLHAAVGVARGLHDDGGGGRRRERAADVVARAAHGRQCERRVRAGGWASRDGRHRNRVSRLGLARHGGGRASGLVGPLERASPGGGAFCGRRPGRRQGRDHAGTRLVAVRGGRRRACHRRGHQQDGGLRAAPLLLLARHASRRARARGPRRAHRHGHFGRVRQRVQ